MSAEHRPPEQQDWQDMAPEQYEATVFETTLQEINRDWVIGRASRAGRMVAEPPRLTGSYPDTEIVVLMWDDNVGTYERRYKVWRDDTRAPLTAIPPPGTRTAPQSVAMAIGDDLHS